MIIVRRYYIYKCYTFVLNAIFNIIPQYEQNCKPILSINLSMSFVVNIR